MEIKKLIFLLPFSKENKNKLYLILKKNKIYTLKVIQKNAYLNLDNGSIVILKNINPYINNLLIEIEQLSLEMISNQEIKKKSKKSEPLWEEENIEFLKLNFNTYTNQELSEKLKKSIHQVQIKKMSLGLYPIKIWSEQEIEFLEQNLNKSLYYLSEKLDRSVASIKAKQRKLRKPYKKY
ncbi:MAG: hypothetical protein ACRC3I_03985 [Cetobacterium sp.]